MVLPQTGVIFADVCEADMPVRASAGTSEGEPPLNANRILLGLRSPGLPAIAAGIGGGRFLKLCVMALIPLLSVAGEAPAQGAGGSVTVSRCKQDSERFGLCTITNNTSVPVVSVEFDVIARDADTDAEISKRSSRVRLFGGLQPGQSTTEKMSWPALPAGAAGLNLRYDVERLIAWDAEGQAAFDSRR